MPSSLFVEATRAFVKVLLTLARAYELGLTISRDSPPDLLHDAYKRVVRKAHPDKGGTAAHFRSLQSARAKWEELRKSARPQGRQWSKVSYADDAVVGVSSSTKGGYRINAASVLLTYHGFKGLPDWRMFIKFVITSLSAWGVLHWCATFEKSEAGKLHAHLALQFTKEIDRTTRMFAFEGRAPNASANDYLGEGFCKRRFQMSVNRSFFYVWADKEGTQRDKDGAPCVEGDHQPVWTKARSRYQVFGKWCENLWKQRKLSHERYEEYLFFTRDGVVSRKRNLDVVKEREQYDDEAVERSEATKRVKSRFVEFAPVPEAVAWLQLFKEELDRYPFLVVLGPSRSRKTEWAKSLFKSPLQLDVGTLEHFPDGIRNFDRKRHDGIVLDDVRDFYFLVYHQEKLQGKVERSVTFAEAPSGGYAHRKWLWKVPIVVTANFSTMNQQLLHTDDFLSHHENRVVVRRQAGVI